MDSELFQQYFCSINQMPFKVQQTISGPTRGFLARLANGLARTIVVFFPGLVAFSFFARMGDFPGAFMPRLMFLIFLALSSNSFLSLMRITSMGNGRFDKICCKISSPPHFLLNFFFNFLSIIFGLNSFIDHCWISIVPASNSKPSNFTVSMHLSDKCLL